MADGNDIAGLAGEYVLGTLDSGERAFAGRERVKNAALNAEIEFWEQWLLPLTSLIPAVRPSPALWKKIESRLFSAASDARQNMERRMRQWRTLALAASFVAILAVTFNVYVAGHFTETPGIVAWLQKDSAAPAFMVSMNEHDRSITVHVRNGDMPKDKSYELWLIADGKSPPHPLGVLTSSRTVLHPDLSGFGKGVVPHATLAISVEPPGGSPTGLPTGPVISTGKFVTG